MIDQNEVQDSRINWLEEETISVTVVRVEDLESAVGNTGADNFVYYEKYKLRVHIERANCQRTMRPLMRILIRVDHNLRKILMYQFNLF